MNSSFFVKPAKNELIETVVHITPDPRPSLTGKVLSVSNKPVSGALVTIFKGEDEQSTIASVYTDEGGIFTFGPLEPSVLYMVKVYKAEDNIRTVE